MVCRTARDIMHPRISLYAKTKGMELIYKLLSAYPALPVVDNDMKVLGIVSEFDVLNALNEGRTVNEFSAESVMSCGHAEHGSCDSPVSVMPETPVEDIIEIISSLKFSILPVVEHNKLIGIISRKNIIYALAEKDYLPEQHLRKRV